MRLEVETQARANKSLGNMTPTDGLIHIPLKRFDGLMVHLNGISAFMSWEKCRGLIKMNIGASCYLSLVIWMELMARKWWSSRRFVLDFRYYLTFLVYRIQKVILNVKMEDFVLVPSIGIQIDRCYQVHVFKNPFDAIQMVLLFVSCSFWYWRG